MAKVTISLTPEQAHELAVAVCTELYSTKAWSGNPPPPKNLVNPNASQQVFDVDATTKLAFCKATRRPQARRKAKGDTPKRRKTARKK